MVKKKIKIYSSLSLFRKKKLRLWRLNVKLFKETVQDHLISMFIIWPRKTESSYVTKFNSNYNITIPLTCPGIVPMMSSKGRDTSRKHLTLTYIMMTYRTFIKLQLWIVGHVTGICMCWSIQSIDSPTCIFGPKSILRSQKINKVAKMFLFTSLVLLMELRYVLILFYIYLICFSIVQSSLEVFI